MDRFLQFLQIMPERFRTEAVMHAATLNKNLTYEFFITHLDWPWNKLGLYNNNDPKIREYMELQYRAEIIGPLPPPVLSRDCIPTPYELEYIIRHFKKLEELKNAPYYVYTALDTNLEKDLPKDPGYWRVRHLYERLSREPGMTWECVAANPGKHWDFSHISALPTVTMQVIEENPDLPWDYHAIAQNPNLTSDFVARHLDAFDEFAFERMLMDTDL